MALGDEASKLWPQVARVLFALPFARARERLTWTTSRPDLPIIWPLGKLQGVFPAADSGKEVASAEADKVIWCNIGDASCVNDASPKMALVYEGLQPSGTFWVIIVVVNHCNQLFHPSGKADLLNTMPSSSPSSLPAIAATRIRTISASTGTLRRPNCLCIEGGIFRSWAI